LKYDWLKVITMVTKCFNWPLDDYSLCQGQADCAGHVTELDVDTWIAEGHHHGDQVLNLLSG
jgi:hypothetical protein